MPSETAPITANQAEICNEDTSGLEIVLRAFDQANRTLSFAIITEPTKGTLGTLYMVDDQYVIIYTPNPNENGEDFFTYIASNGDLNSNETKVTINIYAVNDAPVASFSGPSSVAEDGEAINFALSATDVDGQTGFTFVLKAPPAKGTLAISGEQAVYTPGPDEFGADSFVFVANDGAADSDEITVNLTITPINDAPQISGTPVNATEDTPYSFQMTGTDVDGDSLTYSLINNPGWISIDPDTGELSGTPLYTDEATGLSFTVKVVDDSGEAGNNTAEIVVSLDVIGVNDPPVITGLPADATEDTPYSNTSIAATDEEGDALIFTLAGPEWLSIDPDTGELSGLPLNEHVGENPITITVTAENGASDVLEGTILVINTNDAPLLDPALPKLAVVSGDFPLLVDLSQHFTEVDIGDVLSYSVASSDETTVYGEITGSYLKINKGEGTSKIVVMTVSAHDATASTEGDLYVFFPQSLYANGLNWMDYVKHDGNDVFSAQDIPCDGSETGGYEACVHGGEIRMIETSLETAANPCANLSGSDTLGAFEWVCDDAGPNLVFYSKRLQDGKYLSDLIDFDGATWLENSLVVNDGAEDIYTSMPAKWWGNPIVVDNDGIAPTVSEEKTGTIYLVTSNPDATYIYDKDKIGLVIRP
ncbi:MAG: Ig-like domain-containing protein, partial [Deltaproteobacteria bacterium]|nr:Ig-like domain-containing protein [Deltaproteobacteria bacterium]